MFAEMPDSDRMALVKEFNLQAHNIPLVFEEFERWLLRHAIPFYSWLAERYWGTPDAQELMEFALKSGTVSLNAASK